MTRLICRSFLVVSLALVAVSVEANTIVYSNLGPGDTFNNGSGNSISGPSAPFAVEFGAAAQFTALVDGQLEGLRVPLYDVLNEPTNELTIRLIADSSDSPTGAILESFNVSAVSGHPPQLIAVTSVVNPNLLAGSKYWVMLAASGDDWLVWMQNSTGATGGATTSTNGQFGPVAMNGVLPAFEVTATAVPDAASTLSLFVLGIAVVGAARRRLAA